jgi:hypothetical protein
VFSVKPVTTTQSVIGTECIFRWLSSNGLFVHAACNFAISKKKKKIIYDNTDFKCQE